MRFFPGHTSLDRRRNADIWAGTNEEETMRSELRYFGRLTPLATWRSEYLFRTRLMRSLARGKPGSSVGGVGSAGGRGAAKRKSAVLTYNSKLPWLVSNIHVIFVNGKKAPRCIQASADLGAATVSDPTTGKVDKWGLEDGYMALQLDEVVPHLQLYGLGDGPAACPNVVDVSHTYGVLSGEGFPGGRARFRNIVEATGRYLGGDGLTAVEPQPDIPKIPELTDAISSVWIAKTSAVPAATQSMCGMLTGSTLGIVTAFSLGWDPSGPRFAIGDVTARWVVCPGVPIVALKVDDNYSVKRRSSRRVWAVALNALGEVYYLTETPESSVSRDTVTDAARLAWLAGRTAYWHLAEPTRRIARADQPAQGAYTPRSPCASMGLSLEQLVAEAREIDEYLRFKPSYFRNVCEGWDMRRKLEVDFASDDGRGAGECVFVVDCGMSSPASIQRFVRSLVSPASPASPPSHAPTLPSVVTTPKKPSIFGSSGLAAADCRTPEPLLPRQPPPTPISPSTLANKTPALSDWDCAMLELKQQPSDVTITAIGMDCSFHSILTLGEDPLHAARDAGAGTATPPATQTPPVEIPGRRARFLVVGTSAGGVIAWNGRDEGRGGETVQPLRVIRTDSPSVSCVAASALYLVHGGSDGLVQAWDPLASTSEPIRTLNARSNGRVPRHMLVINPTLQEANYTAVGAIHLDPDPTVLRGVLTFGAFLRYWSYSSASHPTGRKRRPRHSDVHGQPASRRLGGAVSGYIAAEEAELRREDEADARERDRLRKRFGFGALGDLTDDEALRYVQMVSEEAYREDEQRRASDSAADASLDTASSFSEAADTATPDPSVTGASPPRVGDVDFERQMQQAMRLSLLEADTGQHKSEHDYVVKYKARSNKGSPSASAPVHVREDEDLAVALSLSMQTDADFPPLEANGKGKGVLR